MTSGLIYEPRSFWSIEQVLAIPANGRTAVTVQFDRDHFTNGSRHPVRLTRFALAPIGTYIREFVGVVPLNFVRQAASNLNNARILISAPQRQHYSRYDMRIPGWATSPRAEPGMRNTGNGYSSGLWGVSHLAFDRALTLPKLGSLELQLSGYSGTPIVDEPAPRFSVAFHESGGLLPGNARIKSNVDMVRMAGVFPYDADAGVPYPFNGLTGIEAPGAPVQAWIPTQTFNAREFDQQDATQAGSTAMQAMSVHVDQIDWDEFMQTQPGYAGHMLSPMSLGIGSRIRTVDSGSKEWWWRPGAPLALTLDTITPARVYELPHEITLGPGDTLDVELELPTYDPPGALTGTVNNIGISFNGFAAIEG